MANMTIDNLHHTGYNLFSSSENFLNELFQEETELIEGGWYGISGYNSFFGSGFHSHSGSYGSFSGNYSGHSGYYDKSWC
jgi:hypothetical protein